MAAPLADGFEAELLGLEKKLFAYAMSLVGNIDAASIAPARSWHKSSTPRLTATVLIRPGSAQHKQVPK